MKIEINDQRTIREIQGEFSAVYPWLRLEFFTRPHDVGETSPRKQMLQPSCTIGQARKTHNNGSITVSGLTTVAQLEQAFRDLFGLSVQVFRHSGNSWLETTTTDSWTLAKQNNHGKVMTEEH